jgi:hypothetical protein
MTDEPVYRAEKTRRNGITGPSRPSGCARRSLRNVGLRSSHGYRREVMMFRDRELQSVGLRSVVEAPITGQERPLLIRRGRRKTDTSSGSNSACCHSR